MSSEGPKPLLRRLPELEVSPDEPFRHDGLARAPLVSNLSALVGTLSGPFVIALNGPWGGGKSTFLRMWRAYLEGRGHTCVAFNAWETDFSDDPLLAFVSVLDEQLPAAKARAARRRIIDLGATLLRRGIPAAIQVGTAGLLRSEDLEGFVEWTNKTPDDLAKWVSETAAARLKAHRVEREAVDEFRSTLASVARSIAGEGKKKSPLIIFVDELDRCRPSYAVSLLERIKHLFNVEGIVFVLALDMEQLSHSVGAVYGSGFDADGYLRRFVDLVYALPEPDRVAFAQVVISRLEGSRGRQTTDGSFPSEVFGRLADGWHLPLRTCEQLVAEAWVLLRVVPPEVSKRLAELLTFLVILRAVDRPLANAYLQGAAGAHEVLHGARENTGGLFIDTRAGAWLEAQLRLVSGVSGELTRWSETGGAGEGQQEDYAGEVAGAISAIRQGGLWFRQPLNSQLKGYMDFVGGVTFPTPETESGQGKPE